MTKGVKRETAYEVEVRRKIQQTPPDKHPCPECGSEMKKKTIQTFIGEYVIWLCKCGHEEKMK